MDNYWNIEIETFEDIFNSKLVVIKSNNNSGCKHIYIKPIMS